MRSNIKSTIRTAVRRAAIAAGLEIANGLNRVGLMAGARGQGAIFTLHHVRPKFARPFDPNAHLEITPDFLDAVLTALKRDGYRFVALEELPDALAAGEGPLACFTLDDGYRNNLEHALPVFERHAAPFTVFVAGGFVDRTHTLWWETLAELLAEGDELRFDFGVGAETLRARTTSEKQLAFNRVAAVIHSRDEAEAIAVLNAAALECGIDPLAITEQLTLDEAGLRRLAGSPLASLGAHTISHRSVARLGAGEARREIEDSARRVEAITGRRPSTFAYPYGDAPAVSPRDHDIVADLGFTLAVTTRPGTLGAQASGFHALPRISLNGHFQRARYASALASGIPFRLARG
ncbi:MULTISPECIES: polysaccharide deacetylase family protein [unclassified Ensifer]|uniref:polysaccharide deacetylase family protein n=1 Tax=unclassified Ensifer TaxID=2633371 RepID=UPI0008131513|nr:MULTISPECIES: polysaccharide deacetylase family protein [unclassified Ensifer]OCO99841.1 polysaccharide deacetylase [Ensifer sp. LC14]OCP06076.1 polysaccharide deacetylase [Ensifer sp. LC11]OCP07025.1 polysaccharide deacetylase [Ensifer sp. LC13]OCP31520.1 polysaccharide deacetylase [Ensifer sp. LC499]